MNIGDHFPLLDEFRIRDREHHRNKNKQTKIRSSYAGAQPRPNRAQCIYELYMGTGNKEGFKNMFIGSIILDINSHGHIA